MASVRTIDDVDDAGQERLDRVPGHDQAPGPAVGLEGLGEERPDEARVVHLVHVGGRVTITPS